MPEPQTHPSVSFDNTAVAFASKSDGDLKQMYALFAAMNNKGLVDLGGGMMKRALSWGLPGSKTIIKHTIFKQFCGGETIAECKPVIAELGKFNIGTILDYSVEGEGNEHSFDHTRDELLKTIDLAAGHPHIPFSVFKVTGVADSALLEKVQAKQPLAAAEQQAYDRALQRIDALCRRAHERNVRIFIDAEESWFQDTIDDIARDMMRRYNHERAIVWNTYQLYRHDRLDALKADHDHAVQEGYYLGAKLVRGAYMEKEGRVAQQRGYRNPINPSKQATDELYDEALRFSVEHIERLAICAGTHNEASSRLLTELLAEAGLAPNDERVWFAQLYGMSDNLSYNLAHAGYNTAKYVPYGPVEAVMPYLLRRADENTAIAGQSSREFLLIKREMERRRNKVR
ncbi:proline dehydrogenase family protein [Hymenobacter latericus]|uniref:proline dehydrogenase family protein n=1 Tax=Hymenobacter sp. YIM 151858-1 TaxID=2987688 RepID=UPI00222640FE|nr:proline dehydrogenase family protein [Hymenobacter sp. YIM 151858-1]UYZ57376.1 proline dehydrogenase family protein [Hymenobacter sp. YIM 151858-1]